MPVEPPKSYIIEDKNGSGAFDTGDDLIHPTKKTLSEYLSSKTKTQPTKNAYEIGPNLSEVASFNNVTDTTPSIVTGAGSDSPTFVDDVSELAKAYFESLSNGDHGGVNPLSDIIDNTLRAAKHGEKLAEITGDGKTKVEQAVSVILENNRFSSNAKFANAGTPDTISSVQKEKGLFKKTPETKAYTIDDLTSIAASLMISATGRLSNNDDPLEFDGRTIKEDKNPNEVRTGIRRLGLGRVKPSNTFKGKQIINEKAAEGFELELDRTSYGVMNSYLEPFAPPGGLSSSSEDIIKAQYATIVASTAAAGAFVSLISGDIPGIANIKPGSPESIKIKGVSRDFSSGAGSVGFNVGSSIRKALGIANLKRSFLESAAMGVVWFQASTIYGGSGFVASVQRSVVRDAVEFSAALANISAGKRDAGPGSIISMIDELLRSKFMRFIVTMANLGDKILTDFGALSIDANTTALDRKLNEPQSRLAKSRDGHRLVWRAGNINSSYILPASFIGATGQAEATNIRLRNLFSNVSFSKKTNIVDAGTSRLSSEIIQKVEDSLEAEYIPFYFHDLRTNEIVAFHAFLESLSDSYTAAWEATPGIGRVEPVQTYGQTTRAIQLKFMIVATNEEDFDEMYYKINKLVTLVYPQFSKGRTISDGQNTFIQPFSQVQTASPLIRIRLGDILKSNYSKFSLARLFGLGQPENDFKPNAIIDDAKKRAAAYQTALNNVESLDALGVFLPTEQVIISPGRYDFFEALAPNTPPVLADTVYVAKESSQHIKGKVTGYTFTSDATEADRNAIRAAVSALAIASPAGLIPPHIDLTLVAGFIVEVDKSDEPAVRQRVLGAKIQVLAGSKVYVVIPLGKARRAGLGAFDPKISSSSTASANVSDASDFFKPQNNAIVRSFESSRGRGLAGAITSLSFDWKVADGPWNTFTPGSNAPKVCLVDISFTPIHDIVPGIDADGFNRAPVYNVGDIMNAIGGDPYDIQPGNKNTK